VTIATPIARRKMEAGYTLLMVIFMVATMMILALAVTTNVATDGRREKEAEMVWRGEQYERAIGLYQRKFGKYPTKIEDLTKQTNGVRFLRQAYTDPMNSADGSWRFIYVTPNGQLVGSLRPSSFLPVAGSMQGPGVSPFGGPQGGLTQLGGIQQQTPFGGGAQQQLVTATTPNANSQDSQPQPLTGAVLGGSIIGIGSKIKKPSLRVYMGGDNYQQWEFIYSPNGQLILPGQAPVTPNGITGPPGAPGTAPGGTNQNGTPGSPPSGSGGGPNGNGQNGSSPPVTPQSPSDPNNPGGQPQLPSPNQ
jgi:hypothetical protein